MCLNGLGTSAYQAVIQLSIFDTFFDHQRGRALSFYLFGQQLGSILGLITGGSIADGPGWRWSQYIVAIIDAGVLVLLIFTFEETLFPRFLFSRQIIGLPLHATKDDPSTLNNESKEVDPDKHFVTEPDLTTSPSNMGSTMRPNDYPKRSFLQLLKPWVYYAQDGTSYWQYFRRPFMLFTFPNVVIAGVIFAFGCTAGIVSFNTISEIMTEAPYDWSTTSTGLIFLAALVGNVVGWAVGVASDLVVIRLARRNGGVKEPEMRLWALCASFVFAAVGYQAYGWGAEEGLHWISIAIGVGCMIAHQVSACSIATAYAMECFPGVSTCLFLINPCLYICYQYDRWGLYADMTTNSDRGRVGGGSRYLFLLYQFCHILLGPAICRHCWIRVYISILRPLRPVLYASCCSNSCIWQIMAKEGCPQVEAVAG